MNAKEILENEGYEDIVVFENPSYDSALIGVDSSNRAIYDYDLMVEWFCTENKCEPEEAADFINYNTIRALSYMNNEAPIVMYALTECSNDDKNI